MSKKGKFLEDDPKPRNLKKAGLGKLRIKGFRNLIGGILPRTFTIEVPDPSDTTWREQGRAQRKMKKVINYKRGTRLSSVDRLAVIENIMKSGDPNSGNDFNILALELIRELPSLESITSDFLGRRNKYNTIARAVKGLKFIDTWKNIFPNRLLSQRFVKNNITSVMMYLLGTATHPFSAEKPILSMSGHPIPIDYILRKAEPLLRPGGEWFLDIAKKQIVPNPGQSAILSSDDTWEELRKSQGLGKSFFNEKEFVDLWKEKNFVEKIPSPPEEEEEEEEEKEKIIEKPLETLPSLAEIEEEEEGEEEGEIEEKDIPVPRKPITKLNQKEKEFLREVLKEKKMSFLDEVVIRGAINKGVSERSKEQLEEVLDRVVLGKK